MSAMSICQESSARKRPLGASPNRLTSPKEAYGTPNWSVPEASGGGANAAGLIGMVFKAHVVKTPVATSQVAPSILDELGLDPESLKAVRAERTELLPDLP